VPGDKANVKSRVHRTVVPVPVLADRWSLGLLFLEAALGGTHPLAPAMLAGPIGGLGGAGAAGSSAGRMSVRVPWLVSEDDTETGMDGLELPGDSARGRDTGRMAMMTGGRIPITPARLRARDTSFETGWASATSMGSGSEAGIGPSVGKVVAPEVLVAAPEIRAPSPGLSPTGAAFGSTGGFAGAGMPQSLDFPQLYLRATGAGGQHGWEESRQSHALHGGAVAARNASSPRG